MLFNTAAVRNFLIAIVGLLLLAVGARIVGRSHRADYAETARTSVNAIVGLVFVAMGAGAVAVVTFGQKVIDTFGIGK
jgi:hypothetical protein